MPPPELQEALADPARKGGALEAVRQLQHVLAGYSGLMDGAQPSRGGGSAAVRSSGARGMERFPWDASGAPTHLPRCATCPAAVELEAPGVPLRILNLLGELDGEEAAALRRRATGGGG